MLNTKLVSICIPVFNGSNFLRSAIESALNQTYPHIEVIVVNDGSSDEGRTDSIARSFGSRIRYIEQKNKGVAGALNTAIDAARGQYFAWLSHDDIHLPHKTASQIEFLKKLSRPDACLFSDYELIDENSRSIQVVELPRSMIRKSPRLPLLRGYINGCSLLIPMHVIRDFGKFDEKLRYTQDYDLWNKILDRHEFFHQPEVLVKYRIHSAQDSQTARLEIESNPLWKRMIDDRSSTQRAQIAGSSERFFDAIGGFLKSTAMKETSDYALDKAQKARQSTLTSVIIPFFNEVNLLHRAIDSVTKQMGVEVEVIVVNDGSTEDVSSIEKKSMLDPRIKLIHQANQGAGAARNTGMMHARGEYIAFLDVDDVFLPHKIIRQQELMQSMGALFSHTSYYVSCADRKNVLGLVSSGQLSGNCYPSIIADCPIAMPTVMIHRAIIDEGFVFPVQCHIGEDVLAWTDLCARYLLLGIDEPLSVVEFEGSSAAISFEKQVSGLGNIIRLISSDPFHGRQRNEIAKLQDHLEGLLLRRREADSFGLSISMLNGSSDEMLQLYDKSIGRLF